MHILIFLNQVVHWVQSRAILSCLPNEPQASAAVQVGLHASLSTTNSPPTSLHKAKPIFTQMGLVKEGKPG